MKRNTSIYALISVITLFLSILSCEKRDFKLVAKVETKSVTNILAATAKAEGEIIDIGKGVIDYGHCWGLTENPTTVDSNTSFGVIGEAVIFTSNLQNLESRKLYHIRAYIKSGDEVIYGKDISFTTLGAPMLTTTAATAITSSSASIGGNVSADGGSPVTDRGVFWRASSNPDTTGTKLQIGNGTGPFSVSLSGLTTNTLYFFKVYATNSIGTTYGSKLSFTTLSTVPGAPVIGTATAGNGQAAITFTAPVSNGGSPITGYRATSTPGGITGTGTSSPIIVTGLTNGTAFTFNVIAINTTGNSLPSSASNPVTPSTIPGTPTIGTATAGNTQATIAFTAPGSNGGSAITGYTATSSLGGITATGAGSPIVVTGLTNGTAYTFTVIATNVNGNSLSSSASNPVIPSTVPGVPTIGTATAGNGQASVTFTAPADNGGSVITGYRAISNPGGITANGVLSPIIVTGLTDGTAYTFTVIAINATGNSLPSAASNSVTPSTLPGVPINVSATAGDTQASITFTAPGSNGGSAITGYTATSSPGGFTSTGPTSPITITGLTNGTAYTFTVIATNVNGNSLPSNATNSVTPTLSIGSSYQGGIIAYILQPGDPGYIAGETHGLIAALSDQSSGIQWYNGSFTTTGATATALGTGLANTNTIISLQGQIATSYAAGLARAYNGGGYTDWYLPSIDELYKLYLNKVAIGGFGSATYWSSSETDYAFAWYQRFVYTGSMYTFTKSNSYAVRAIRAF